MFASPLNRITLTHLRWVKEFFNSIGVPYFVTMGPCLSIIRNGNLRGMTLPDNQDLDIYVRLEDKPLNIAEALLNAGWSGRYGDRILPEDCDDWNAFAWRWDRDEVCVLDIHYLHKHDQYRYAAMMTQYCLYDSSLFDEAKNISFEGLSIPMPNPPEEYLRQEYGDDWRVPQGIHFHEYPSVWRAREYELHEKLLPEERYEKYDSHAVDWVLEKWRTTLRAQTHG